MEEGGKKEGGEAGQGKRELAMVGPRNDWHLSGLGDNDTRSDQVL